VGALSAIVGQSVAARHAERRHELEIQQRERQMWAQFVAPIATRRIDAFEAIHDTIQTAIETGEIPMNEYISLRRRLLYMPSGLRAETLAALTSLLSARREPDSVRKDSSIAALKVAQASIEEALGIRRLEEGLSRIGFSKDLE
jgi:hypothetical protein